MVLLAATHHDPDGRLLVQLRRIGPALFGRYQAVLVIPSKATIGPVLDAIRDLGGTLVPEGAGPSGAATLGANRHAVIARAAERDLPIHLCDLDRALHWAEQWPVELDEVVAAIPAEPFLVLGRTERAFSGHPQVQRETEAQINRVYALCTGRADDITAASRGIQPEVARWLAEHDDEPSIGVDGTWPLRIARSGRWPVTYRATEGLEFESAEGASAAIARSGSQEAWLADLDRDPEQWRHRVWCAHLEIEAIVRAWQSID